MQSWLRCINDRLNAATLSLPALSERQDFDALVDHLLAEIRTRYDGDYRLAACALHRHRWPDNLRELRNALEVGATLCRGGVIHVADLPEDLGCGGESPLPAQLAACDGNVSRLARRRGVNCSTVHRRLKQGTGRRSCAAKGSENRRAR